ncbi:hypothetical protein [Enterovibrio sp. 27052020O]|uniref:hypothetical protein n=1 Tax=Enterovibrio sp. 27052020O TaxID=3241166 RepID=UPI00388EC347
MIRAPFQSLLPMPRDASLMTKVTQLDAKWQWADTQEENTVSLAQLSNDSDYLHQRIQEFARAYQAPREKVAASLVHKQLVAAILSPLMAIYLLTDNDVPCNAEDVFFAKDTQRISWHQSDCTPSQRVSMTERIAFLSHVDERLHAFFRKEYGVSARILWSNSALAFSAPWNRLITHKVDGTQIRAQLAELFTLLPPPLATSIHWLVIRCSAHTLCVPRRTSCCLKYALPDSHNALCGTCHRRSEQAQRKMIEARFIN